MVGSGEPRAAAVGERQPAPTVGRQQVAVVAGRVGMVGHRQHAHQIAYFGRPAADEQLTIHESLALPADAPVDADRRRVEQPPRGCRVIPQPLVEDAGIVTVWPPAEDPDPPREPRRRPSAARHLAGEASERVVLGEPLEEGEPEQFALSLVDGHSEVIVEGIAERMADEKRAAAVHAEAVDRPIAHTLACHDLRRDRLQLPRLPCVDRRRGPRGEAVAGDDAGGDPRQSPLHEFTRGDRLAPGAAAQGMVAGLPQEQPERACRLCGERDAATVESMPDDPHGVGRSLRRLQDVGCLHLVPCEFDRRVVRMLERMETIVPQSKRRRVGIGQPHEHHRRSSVELGEQLHEPAVGRAGDEHFCAREQQSVALAVEPRGYAVQIAAGVGLGGTEDGERYALCEAGQMSLLLALRPKRRQRRDRTDRGMDGEKAGGRGHIGGDPRDDAGQFLHGAARATKPFRNEQPPEPRLSKGQLRRLRERSDRRGRSIIERRRRPGGRCFRIRGVVQP